MPERQDLLDCAAYRGVVHWWETPCSSIQIVHRKPGAERTQMGAECSVGGACIMHAGLGVNTHMIAKWLLVQHPAVLDLADVFVTAEGQPEACVAVLFHHRGDALVWQALETAPRPESRVQSPIPSTWRLHPFLEPPAACMLQQALFGLQYAQAHGISGMTVTPHVVATCSDWVTQREDGVDRKFCPMIKLAGLQMTTEAYPCLGDACLGIVDASFRAPEVCNGLTVPVDTICSGLIAGGLWMHQDECTTCWELGCFMFVVLTGELPFCLPSERLLHLDRIKARICKREFTQPAAKAFKLLSPGARSLLQSLLTVDPARRMTLHQALSHPWVASQLSQPLLTWHMEQLRGAEARMAMPAVRSDLQQKAQAIEAMAASVRQAQQQAQLQRVSPHSAEDSSSYVTMAM